MNGDDAKKLNSTINKSSAISVGVVIVIISATVWISSSMTKVQAEVTGVVETVSTLDEDYVPRRELELIVENIQESVVRIEKALVK